MAWSVGALTVVGAASHPDAPTNEDAAARADRYAYPDTHTRAHLCPGD